MNHHHNHLTLGQLLTGFAIGILACLLLTLAGCRTTKTTTEVYLHDTLRVHTSDTIYQRIVAHHTDTVRDKEVTRIVLRDSGDTIKVYNDHYIYRYVGRNDSTDIYKTRIDSLLKVLDQRQNEKKVIKQGPPLYEKLVFVAIIAMVVFIVVKFKK